MTSPTAAPTIKSPSMAILLAWLIGGLLIIAAASTWLSELVLILSGATLLGTFLGLLVDAVELLWLKLLPRALAGPTLLRRGACVAFIVGLTVMAFIGLIAMVLPGWQVQLAYLLESLPRALSIVHLQWQATLHWLQAHPVLAPFHTTVEHSLIQLQTPPAAKVVTETVAALSSPLPTGAAPTLPAATATTPFSPAYPPGFLQRMILGSLTQVASVVSASLNGLVYGLVGAVIILYTLMDRHLARRAVERLLPQPWQRAGHFWRHALQQQLANVILGQVITAALAGLVLFVVYQWLGIPFASVLSVLYALCAVIPGVGAWFGVIPNGVMLLASHNGWALLTAITALLGVYCFKAAVFSPWLTAQQWPTPWLRRPALRLNPLLVAFCLMLCWTWLGFLGVLACVPLAALITTGLATWKAHLKGVV